MRPMSYFASLTMLAAVVVTPSLVRAEEPGSSSKNGAATSSTAEPSGAPAQLHSDAGSSRSKERPIGQPRAAEDSGSSQEPSKKKQLTVLRDRNKGLRWGLIASGSAVLTLFYVFPCLTEGGWWCVPVAGPVSAIQKRDREERQSTNEDGIVPPVFVYTLFAGVGAAQVVGIGLVTVGALLPSRPVRETLVKLNIVPLVSSDAVVLTLGGTL
jgi:hypothetical protein